MATLDRNTIVGIDFLVVGLVLTGLGYILAQSIPIAAIGVDVAIIGALILLIVPEPIPQDAYTALLNDSISNIEIILEESNLEEKAYFIPAGQDGEEQQQQEEDEQEEIRAFVPATPRQISSGSSNRVLSSANLELLLQSVSKSPRRFVHSYEGGTGLVLIPPGNEIVKLAKVRKGDDLEDSLRSALVNYSDLASSVMSISEQEEGGRELVKIKISDPKLISEYPSFDRCLGSPVSCVASCVVAIASGKMVRFVDEKRDGEQKMVHLTLEVISSGVS